MLGVELLYDYRDLAVMGFMEVVKHIPKHAALLRTLRARFRAWHRCSGRRRGLSGIQHEGRPRRARGAGVPVVYYITPQVWAWGAKRLPTLARIITKAAVITPFRRVAAARLWHRHHIRWTSAARPRGEHGVARRGAPSARRPR